MILDLMVEHFLQWLDTQPHGTNWARRTKAGTPISAWLRSKYTNAYVTDDGEHIVIQDTWVDKYEAPQWVKDFIAFIRADLYEDVSIEEIRGFVLPHLGIPSFAA